MKEESRVEAIVYTSNTGSAAQYAEMLAKLFLNADGSMKRWQVSNIKKKLHKKTYSIQ